MKSISSVEEIESTIRQVLISQSDLSENQVLNSLSIHGENLDKLFEEQVYVSIDRADALLLFELQSRKSTSDVSYSITDETNEYYRSFSVRCVIYGNDSTSIANKIVARFRSSATQIFLQSQGIYLEEIEEPDILNEYKNDTMWTRNDILINISCKFIISNFNQEKIQNITIKEIII